MKPSRKSPVPSPDNSSSGAKRGAPWLAGGLVLAIAAAVFYLRQSPAPENDGRAVSESTAPASPRNSAPAASSASAATPAAPESAASAARSDSAASPASASPASGPEKTRATRRDEIVTASGKRKTLVDPMTSWSDTPPWPEGPRLFVEAETSSRRYINLRPDDIGELPRILADAEERIELRVNFPEGEPGERIHVELPNGGSFTDTDARGRIYHLPENRTLSFPFIADESRGHCNVKLRHRGHSRSLPVWVGELPEPAPSDSDS